MAFTLSRNILRWLPWACGLLAGVAVAVACGIFWNASLAVNISREAFESKGQAQSDMVRLDRRGASGFEPISAPAVFEDMAVFHGHIFICGPAGLSEYDAEGNPVAKFRPGFELPAAPLVRLHTGVAADAQEPELYVATAGEGLLAFNGRGFRQIRARQPGDRKLTAVLISSSGKALMGTAKDGVLAYDGKRLKLLHPNLAGFAVTALAGTDSDLWIGTLDQGLLHLVAGRIEHLQEADGMPDARVTTIEMSEGMVYAGTPVGVAEVRDGHVVRVLAQGSFAQSLLVKGTTLLVGTLEDGTLQVSLNSKGARPRRTEQAEAGQSAVRRLLMQDGRVLVLRDDRLEADGLTLLRRDQVVLKDNNIAAIAPDDDGRLWVGYFDRGMELVDADLLKSVHTENEYVYCVNQIVHDPKRKQTGVATANGFVLFDSTGSQRQVLTKTDGLIANHVTSALLATDGSWTLGTPAGITFLEGGRASSIYARQGLVNNHVYALGECGGRMIAGTLGGASMLEQGLIRTNYTNANSPLKQNWITAISRLSNGGCLLGTYGAGVISFDQNGKWKTFADMPAGVEVNPNAMISTSRAVYVGTLGKGLGVYDPARERWTWVTEGLPSLNVTALGLGPNGLLYIGTDNGLVRAPVSSLLR